MNIRSTRAIGAQEIDAASPGAMDERSPHRSVIYQGHEIVLTPSEHGWSACVVAMAVETMCFADRFAALAAGQEIVDGLLRAEQAAEPIN